MFDREEMKWDYVKKKKMPQQCDAFENEDVVRPTGIEPVLRASETRILSVGRRSRVQLFADRYCSG